MYYVYRLEQQGLQQGNIYEKGGATGFAARQIYHEQVDTVGVHIFNRFSNIKILY